MSGTILKVTITAFYVQGRGSRVVGYFETKADVPHLSSLLFGSLFQ
jgi:hypothetical protein